MSQEVEYLSVRNEKMLSDLKRKDPFYDTYVKTSEELSKLRDAHVVLISMIKNKQLTLKNKELLNEGAEGGLFGKVDNFEVELEPQNNRN